MGLDKILSIGGKPGLYKLITQTRSGFVAESLQDGKRISVGVRSNVSVLSEIAIYTLEEELPLREVFLKIHTKENGKKTSVNHKDDKLKLEEYFFEVLPNYDEDRVYVSDIKKVIQWYNILNEKGISDFTEEKVENENIAKTADKKALEKKVTEKKPVAKKQSVSKTSGKKILQKNQAAKKT